MRSPKLETTKTRPEDPPSRFRSVLLARILFLVFGAAKIMALSQFFSVETVSQCCARRAKGRASAWAHDNLYG